METTFYNKINKYDLIKYFILVAILAGILHTMSFSTINICYAIGSILLMAICMNFFMMKILMNSDGIRFGFYFNFRWSDIKNASWKNEHYKGKVLLTTKEYPRPIILNIDVFNKDKFSENLIQFAGEKHPLSVLLFKKEES